MKAKIVGILVVALLMAAAVVPVGKTLDVGNHEDRERSDAPGEVSKRDGTSSNPLFLRFLLRLVNGDWDYWSNAPHLFTIPEGNVGIGTDTPAENLHVKGEWLYQALFESTDASGGITLKADTGQEYGMLAMPDDLPGRENWFVIRDKTAEQQRLLIDKDGNVIINTPGAGLTFPDGTTQTTAGGGDGGGGWIISGDNLYSAVSGNVGIGTGTPESKLDVAGDIHVSRPGLRPTILYIDEDEEQKTANIMFQHQGDNRWLIEADYGVNDGLRLYRFGDTTAVVMCCDYETGRFGNYHGFPRPDYDSGWIPWPDGHEDTLVHDLGGNVDNYVVDLQGREDTYGITNLRLGGDEYATRASLTTGVLYGYEDQGYYYKNLDSDSITIKNRGNSIIDEIRVRIWVYE